MSVVMSGCKRGEAAGVTIPRAFVSVRWSQTPGWHPFHSYMYFNRLASAQLTIYMISRFMPKVGTYMPYYWSFALPIIAVSLICHLVSYRGEVLAEGSDWSEEDKPRI
jgi:hypothetical protein